MEAVLSSLDSPAAEVGVMFAALLAVAALALVARHRRLRSVVYGGLVTILALLIGLAALHAPIWLQCLVGIAGIGLVTSQVVIGHREAHDLDADLATVHRRLNALDALMMEQRNNLLRRLYQVQTEVAALTREHYLAKAGIVPEELRGDAHRAALYVLNLENDAVGKYRDHFDTEVLFLMRAFRQAGIEEVPEVSQALAEGVGSAADINNMAQALQWMIRKVRKQDGW